MLMLFCARADMMRHAFSMTLQVICCAIRATCCLMLTPCRAALLLYADVMRCYALRARYDAPQRAPCAMRGMPLARMLMLLPLYDIRAC